MITNRNNHERSRSSANPPLIDNPTELSTSNKTVTNPRDLDNIIGDTYYTSTSKDLLTPAPIEEKEEKLKCFDSLKRCILRLFHRSKDRQSVELDTITSSKHPTKLYDDAMTCLCFTCEKCLKIQEVDKLNTTQFDRIEKDSEDLEFITEYKF